MLGIYIHLPFCRRRCSYCAFAISTDQSQQAAYVAALLQEMARSPVCASPADTVYLGGGTPSLTPYGLLQSVVAGVRDLFQVSSDAEVTLEANPEDVNEDLLRAWRDEIGVNRLSLGVQSFHDQELYPLGRGHGSRVAREAIALAVQSGMRVSLDLILGLPYQTAESFEQSLRVALGSGIAHLSLYMLDLEESSPLEAQVRRGLATLPDQEMISSCYRSAMTRIARAGLRQYEVSNFARPGEESRHNLKYWTRQPYAGFGLGAHSFDGRERFANTPEIGTYIERISAGESPEVFREVLGSLEETRESIFLGLRQVRGMRYSELIQLRGEEATEWVSRGLSEGWLRSSDDRVAFTTSGFLLSNDYLSQLF